MPTNVPTPIGLKVEPKHVNVARYLNRSHPSIERGAPQVPYAVIWHWSAGWGELDSLYAYLARRGADESYNYAVDRSGRCGEIVASENAAWHAGDGKLPPLELLDDADGFVAGDDVRHVPRVINLRSVGVCCCNVGFLTESKLIEAHHKKAKIVEGVRHYNPRSHETKWEGYTDHQIGSAALLLAWLKAKHPTLRMILGHQDVTNYDSMNVKGSKTDPGPDEVFPWERLGYRALGMTRVKYDFARRGYAVVR